MSKKRELKETEKESWEQLLQVCCLKAISEKVNFTSDDLVFHGGTSLRFSWGSPRHSEDLDFMISEKASEDLEDLMSNVLKDVEKQLKTVDPEFSFRFKHKSRRDGQLHNYMLIMEKKDVLGSAKVKTEFWQVDNDFLPKYNSTLRQPSFEKVYDMNMQSEVYINAASMETAHCDKMVALATRPFMKWRDFFDIWWLTTQKDINPIEVQQDKYLEEFYYNLGQYNVPKDMTLIQSLQRYIDMDDNEMLEKSQHELRNWLSDSLWNKLFPDQVKQMIKQVKNQAQKLIELVEKNPSYNENIIDIAKKIKVVTDKNKESDSRKQNGKKIK